ncbi:MAG: glycoside hydrolase family 99-like domain-containing protein [Nitrospira sp.]|nr:glycoside hydrolase family 99-like domain-containing protein [Nitrospira sp.]
MELQFRCEDLEPNEGVDIRPLGVKIVRIAAGGPEDSVRFHEALAEFRRQSATVLPTAGPRQGPAGADASQSPQSGQAGQECPREATTEAEQHRRAVEALFDREFYLAGFAPGTAPDDPVAHYLERGWLEGRNPTPWFSGHHYLARHADVAAAGMNPFLHYCIAGKAEGRALVSLGRASDSNIFKAHSYAVGPGPYFEEFDPTIGEGRSKRAKVLAYYLPQFHAVDVNDQHWGKGFTEWRQLPRALPRFHGHIQPRIPRDLGCYDLAESDVMRRQIEMARAAGIYGFCFYYYWFDGRRVLEKPLERFLKDPTLNFPFCLMWANENWTRTWDGAETEIILKQNYRAEDEEPFIDDIARHMRDPRYIKIGDRPLFFIYRPGHVPDSRRTFSRWREIFERKHSLQPFIFHAQAFGDNDPRVFGLDGAIEFPPHKILSLARNIVGDLPVFDSNFTGDIRSYDDLVNLAISDPPAEFPLIRTVFPCWDNDARRPGRGTIVAYSTPEKFGKWLDWAIRYANEHKVYGESFVCVNAWNEWAEGAYLEPDVHFGGAYLNALSRVVHGGPITPNYVARKLHILLVGHDMLPMGAQRLLGQIASVASSQFGCEISFLILDTNDHDGRFGTMEQAYKGIGAFFSAKESNFPSILDNLRERGCTFAVTNTTVAGNVVPALKQAGFTVLSLIHELPNLLRQYRLEAPARAIAQQSDHVVFPAEVVRAGFEHFAGPVSKNVVIAPQGLYNTSVLEATPGDQGLRAELALPRTCKIVLGVGYADLRKGIDRFVAAGLSLCARRDDVVFLWVGHAAAETKDWFLPEIQAAGMADRVRFIGPREDVARFFAAADVFYLSSREDPFPSVVLEALACGLPVVGHAGTGGCDELIARHGILLPQTDPLAVTEAINNLLARKDRKAAAARRSEIVQKYRFDAYVFGLLRCLDPRLVSVSALVPNYRYEPYIAQRLQSVFDQTYPLREVVVLDDASPDESVAVIRRTAETARRHISLHVNRTNSGSVFRQWRRGVELCQGEYIWIAEADDLAEPDFVAKLIARMAPAGSVLGFTDSRQIDEHGVLLGETYRPYMNDIEPGAFEHAFDMDGQQFLRRFLAVKNVILNVSGVIFRRDALLDAFTSVGDNLLTYRVAGDWRLYAEICARPGARVSYLPEPLNSHRRHNVSVTHALDIEKHLDEIAGMHRLLASLVKIDKTTQHKQALHLEQCREWLTRKR